MSTRSAIAVPYGDGWKGSYVHFDGYPTGRGPALWEFLNTHGWQAYADMIEANPAGWSSMPESPTEIGYTDSPDAKHMTEQGKCGPACNPLFIEWVYVVAENGALTIYSSDDTEVPSPLTDDSLGNIGQPDKGYYHKLVWTGRWDGPEPDWAAIEKSAYPDEDE